MTYTPRTMIIIWSWKHSGMTAPFDIWEVEGSPDDRVIRMDVRWSTAAVPLLRERIEAEGLDRSVYLFLHRRHGYSEKAIAQLLGALSEARKSRRNTRSFLFGEGGDFIYIAHHPRGLLGTKGTFSAQFDSPYQEQPQRITAIADREKRLLKKVHFDTVWQRYTHNFKAKIFELREDLFRTLLPFMIDQKVDSGDVYQFFQQPENRPLFLRLLSFIGKLRKGSDLEQALRDYEQQQKRSFFFDDCQENLKAGYSERESQLYAALATDIRQQLLVANQQIDLLQLRHRFDELLSNMPESAYS
jgi:hypothetical protein